MRIARLALSDINEKMRCAAHAATYPSLHLGEAINRCRMDIERSCEIGDIEPITVAAYIEILQRQAAPPTVKQHIAAIRMLFSWLTEKGVLAMNPAREAI